MGMPEAVPQLFPGPLSAAVTAAMHAMPSGNVYWGDAAVQTDPSMPGQDLSADAEGLQHEGALQPQLAGQEVPRHFEPVYQGDHAAAFP